MAMKNTKADKKSSFDEFECPECSAHNPWGIGFNVGDEVYCNWCGIVFRVKKKVTLDEEKAAFRLERT